MDEGGRQDGIRETQSRASRSWVTLMIVMMKTSAFILRTCMKNQISWQFVASMIKNHTDENFDRLVDDFNLLGYFQQQRLEHTRLLRFHP